MRNSTAVMPATSPKPTPTPMATSCTKVRVRVSVGVEVRVRSRARPRAAKGRRSMSTESTAMLQSEPSAAPARMNVCFIRIVPRTWLRWYGRLLPAPARTQSTGSAAVAPGSGQASVSSLETCSVSIGPHGSTSSAATPPGIHATSHRAGWSRMSEKSEPKLDSSSMKQKRRAKKWARPSVCDWNSRSDTMTSPMANTTVTVSAGTVGSFCACCVLRSFLAAAFWLLASSARSFLPIGSVCCECEWRTSYCTMRVRRCELDRAAPKSWGDKQVSNSGWLGVGLVVVVRCGAVSSDLSRFA
eukprot:scaffold95967_cov63-Phaeocystis_antarctica.AAC.4